ncbi:MAG TPA: tRNA 5-methoxyuridine(34)/uridine 5-oxyacetic acid(34) synthase CmoB [Caldithrix abyssi]|uniref:tRNA 5-methoxyuridine(34)/uridine 5-oxyacetic acid(34) synthase CmoB n=1 Tax=Caldithrix abyssi TaxID=187145 RepID=A0A7V1LP61_CALAY|nr:tRNA 5-methoxyuridine(34)/uridine 5-oxyacetic acid(34) synthase CmoB [Caldithrix abyssi]
MLNWGDFMRATESPALNDQLIRLREKEPDWFSIRNHGDYEKWRQALQAIHDLVPPSPAITTDFSNDSLRIGRAGDIPEENRQRLRALLMNFHPWRKGPFEFFGIPIDTEWRSDWKWKRLLPHISPLKDRLVLDIGSGNGYFSWRMWAAGARAVLAADPMLLYTMQFRLVASYVPQAPVVQLPLPFEALERHRPLFDTVFSLGVLYHRRSPMDHLLDIRNILRPGGELVLETLVTEGPRGHVFVPPGRYARMRNVWFIPSTGALEDWLARCGFERIHLADVNVTSRSEQRSTEWMQYESLADFLDKDDPSKTLEGHPRPRRALFIANRV